MHEAAQYTFESAVPHTGDMVLLDQIDHWDDQHLQASVTIRTTAPFVDERGMPGWVGIEMMAQAVAAHGGCRARRQQEAVKIGFLLGSRKYQCSHSYFPLGAQLQVTVRQLMSGDNGLSVFECTLRGLGEHAAIAAEANINVFKPDDPEQFLQGQVL